MHTSSFRRSVNILQKKRPGYETLSYVWGSKNNPSCAYIRDSRHVGVVPITQNLDIALRHWRSTSRIICIWVDALCIDQQNTGEKSSQVSIIGRIYSLASSVLIWLGPAENNSDEALALLKSLGGEVDFNRITEEMQPSSHCTSVKWVDVTEALPYKAGELDLIQSLFARPYFRRAWIRQEMVLARKVTVRCGLKTVPWKEFRCAVACLFALSYYEEALPSGTHSEFSVLRKVIYNICQITHGTMDLSSLRHSQAASDCYDNRDRIYSVISLLSHGTKIGH